MHIIIVGCGKVGRTLADQLQEEDTDLTLIRMLSMILLRISMQWESSATVPVSIHLWRLV